MMFPKPGIYVIDPSIGPENKTDLYPDKNKNSSFQLKNQSTIFMYINLTANWLVKVHKS